MISMNGVWKKYGNHDVLKNVNLSIGSHEAIHVSGINGSGKTTLLKLLANLSTVDKGIIKNADNVIVGALIENPTFIRSYTAKENIDLLYKLVSKESFCEAKLIKLFNLFELDYYDSRPVSKYSLGMLQKLGIIQSIMENQNLILLDEPTRGLDEESQMIFCELVNELVRSGKSVIIASHDFDNLKPIKFTKRYVINDYDIKTV